MIIAEKTTQAENVIVVNLGELFVTRDPSAVLACVGLGSCIAVCIYDTLSKTGGMAHIVLPQSNGTFSPSAKFADIAIPLLLEQMSNQGAYRRRLTVKLVGGARMGLLNNHVASSIGEKNAEAVKSLLNREGVSVAAADVGGNHGRSVKLYLSTGKVIVKNIGSEGREL